MKQLSNDSLVCETMLKDLIQNILKHSNIVLSARDTFNTILVKALSQIIIYESSNIEMIIYILLSATQLLIDSLKFSDDVTSEQTRNYRDFEKQRCDYDHELDYVPYIANKKVFEDMLKLYKNLSPITGHSDYIYCKLEQIIKIFQLDDLQEKH